MKTSTHDGTCQVCGRQQRLPGNRMAKHGYTILGRNGGGHGGYFSGECWGSQELPIQVSCDLVKLSIERATKEVERLRGLQEEKRRPATEPTGPVRVWNEGKHGLRGFYSWVEGRVVARLDGSEYFDIEYTHGGKVKRESAYRLAGYEADNTALGIASKLRRVYADALTPDIDQLDEYIRMQQLRVDTWKPMPLLKRAG